MPSWRVVLHFKNVFIDISSVMNRVDQDHYSTNFKDKLSFIYLTQIR